MAGLVPAIHALQPGAFIPAWMPATGAGMTAETAAQMEREEWHNLPHPSWPGLSRPSTPFRPRACVAAWMPATSAGMTGAYPATSGKTAPSFTTPITKFDSMAAMHLRRVSRVLTKRS